MNDLSRAETRKESGVFVRELKESELFLYDGIPMTVNIKSELVPERLSPPFRFGERALPPCQKDLGKYFSARRDAKIFGQKNRAFFLAETGGAPAGGAFLIWRTEGIRMLEGRNDLCVLWDLRVDEKFRRQGVGTALFRAAAERARAEGLKEMKIESQNNNLAAYRFYLRQNAVLTEINAGVYGEEECKEELQFLWKYSLKSGEYI